MDGVLLDAVGANKYYTLPKTYKGKELDTDEMEHFADAEKRYQEKIEQIEMNYNMDDPLVERREVTLATTECTTEPYSGEPTTTMLDYEYWPIDEE